MSDARLEVTDALGRRIVPISKGHFEIGRRETNDLRLAGSEVSRDHAEIDAQDNAFLIRDKNSRYGTYVNGEQVTEQPLVHGDRIRLGRSGGAEMVFLLADNPPAVDKATTTAIGDLRQIAALLEGLRALGSGRVLDDVLALVLDSAIEVSGAERGFIMLSAPTDELEFKMARSRGRNSIPGGSFATSRKIPEEVFRTGEPRIVADLLDGDLANVHREPSRSASATCCACRCDSCAISIAPKRWARSAASACSTSTAARRGRSSPTRRAPRSKRSRPKPRSPSRTPGSIARRWRRRGWSRRCGSRPRSSRRCCRRPAAPAPTSAPRRRRCRAARSAATSTTTSICPMGRSDSRSATSPVRVRPPRS